MLEDFKTLETRCFLTLSDCASNFICLNFVCHILKLLKENNTSSKAHLPSVMEVKLHKRGNMSAEYNIDRLPSADIAFLHGSVSYNYVFLCLLVINLPSETKYIILVIPFRMDVKIMLLEVIVINFLIHFDCTVVASVDVQTLREFIYHNL